MEYNAALEWLHSLGRVAKAPGPERMQGMMKALGDPQKRLRFVHVAGTNGKGSATTMVASILKEAGYKTGANIGPFVLDFRERFQIDGEYATEEQVAAAITQVHEAAQGLPEPPIGFVATTATAFVLFAEAGCDIVCLEAGIGGAHDDTNIIEDTLVACMMKVGLDHTELLGDTVEKIAEEKCGIFKNECTVVSYPAQPGGVMEVIRREAKAKGCKLVVPDLEDLHFYKSRPFENRICYGGYDLCVPFIGPHQALNAAVAVEAAIALWQKGFEIEDEHIIKGIEAARLPARIEVLSGMPLIILDGAHNEDSVEALALTLREQRVANLTAVIGVLRDKQPDAMLKALRPYISTLYTVTPGSPRAMPAEELAELARGRYVKVAACDTMHEAISKAVKEPGRGILICGSFYLAAEAKKEIEEVLGRR